MDADLLRYLAEDLGAPDAAAETVGALLARDATSAALAGDARLRAHVIAREACVLAGSDDAAAVFGFLGAMVEHRARDGERVPADAVILVVDGPAHAVLTAERLALNLLMRMSGIATLTRELQDKVAALHPACRIAATRKTTPGFRKFEKRAVEIGGGDPHRFGLFDAFLIKDNHLLAEPDVARAVARCRAHAPGKPLQVEADTPAQALAAADAGADAVLLDNFDAPTARATYRALKARHPNLLVEVSGGLRPENVTLYADAADRLSLGWLTHSPRAIDFGLDVVSATKP